MSEPKPQCSLLKLQRNNSAGDSSCAIAYSHVRSYENSELRGGVLGAAFHKLQIPRRLHHSVSKQRSKSAYSHDCHPSGKRACR